MNGTLFDLPEPHQNKFVEPMLTREDRIRKLARSGHPSTSYEAAEVTEKKLTRRMSETLEVFRLAGRGLIGEELDNLAQVQGMRAGSAPKRIKDLADAGLIVWDGEFRLTSGGCRAKVWHIARH